MNMEERIRRINELYHKSQREGLTDAEKEEQAKLRREYVESVRGNLRAQLDNISIQHEDGTVEKLRDRRRAENLQEAKEKLRRQVLRCREALDEQERKLASVALSERILGHQWFYLSDTVLGFAGYGSEIDTDEILRECIRQGKRLYLPKVEGEEMRFYRVYDLEKLCAGYKGIREPAGDTEQYVYAPAQTGRTLMLMPGVAFDPRKGRMGYGRGFYDRFLQDKEDLRLRTIGIGFACQMVEEVPCGERDVRPYQVICI